MSYTVAIRWACVPGTLSCPLRMSMVAHVHSHSTAANLSLSRINYFDTKCDEECEYFFNKKIADMSQHNMTRCYSCGNCWDGFAQCLCYNIPPRVDSDEHERSDEEVFSPKARSISPYSTRPSGKYFYVRFLPASQSCVNFVKFFHYLNAYITVLFSLFDVTYLFH